MSDWTQGEPPAGEPALPEVPAQRWDMPLAPPPAAAPAQATPVKKSRKPKWIVGAILVVLIVAVAAAVFNGSSDKKTLRGLYVLTDSSGSISGGSYTNCKGTGGFDDVRDGAAIQVTDADHKIIGSGALTHASDENELKQRLVDGGEANTLDVAETYINDLVGNNRACILEFDIKVPNTDFYEIGLGNQHRGNITYSKEELAKNKNVATLTLSGD